MQRWSSALSGCKDFPGISSLPAVAPVFQFLLAPRGLRPLFPHVISNNTIMNTPLSILLKPAYREFVLLTDKGYGKNWAANITREQYIKVWRTYLRWIAKYN